MKSILQMILVLSLLCGSAGFCLSYLKITTASRIESQALTFVQGPAILDVFKDAENSPIDDRRAFTLADGSSVNVFPCIRDGVLTGVAVERFGSGYGGDLGVVVGFNIREDTLAGIGITTMKETAGVGTRVKEPVFLRQFPGKSLPVKLRNQGGDIDAISGATVSSNGVMGAVERAAAVYEELKPLLLETWK
ncbi:RnfABCDGE type electron transport complex subunit G [uncultured Mailhella sp.]|uniref:RnfABCDGE type electron transport complex subunit G n=1 Tax=uncultured Mailhella sp. TaxID=1981031 RepID=UPI0026141392|nr:FMN-binding protein [uncultured Mailhella sp.]